MSLILINRDGPELQKCWERPESSLPFVNISVQMYGILKEELSFFEVEGFSEALFFKKNPEKEITEGWFVLSKYNQFVNKIKIKIKNDPSYLDRLLKKIEVIFEEFKIYSERSKEVEVKITQNEDLLEIANYYYNLSYKSVIAAWSFDIIGWVMLDILESELKKQGLFSYEKIIILTSYGIRSIIVEEKTELSHLIKEGLTENKLRDHYKKWHFVKTGTPVDQSPSFEAFKKSIDEIKSNHAEEILKIEEKRENELMEFNKNFIEIKDQNLSNLINITRKFIELKNNERILIHKYVGESLNVIISISQKLGLNPEYANYISSEEILQLIRKEIEKESLEAAAAKRRKEGFIFKFNNKKLLPLQIEEKMVILRGFSASKGYIKGKVKIIQSFSREKNSFNPGEILVTSMTTPDFVPLMEKASAIITNEGGILCHAAIVSREFGIPCIVGTEKATEVLHNGDLIEVDATNYEGKITVI